MSKRCVEIVAIKDRNHPHYLPIPATEGKRKVPDGRRSALLCCLFLYPYVQGMQNCGREPLYHLQLPPVKEAFPSKQFTWFSDVSVTRLLQITYYQEATTQALVCSIGITWQEKKHSAKMLWEKKLVFFPLQTFLWSWPATLLFPITLGM